MRHPPVNNSNDYRKCHHSVVNVRCGSTGAHCTDRETRFSICAELPGDREFLPVALHGRFEVSLGRSRIPSVEQEVVALHSADASDELGGQELGRQVIGS